eukprot:360870-Chlamydomonas_euryale.AAC.9
MTTPRRHKRPAAPPRPLRPQIPHGSIHHDHAASLHSSLDSDPGRQSKSSNSRSNSGMLRTCVRMKNAILDISVQNQQQARVTSIHLCDHLCVHIHPSGTFGKRPHASVCGFYYARNVSWAITTAYGGRQACLKCCCLCPETQPEP